MNSTLLSSLMHEAVHLAKNARGQVAPNPMVGAVITTDTGDIIGRGFHPRAGEPHAEVFAIRDAEAAGFSVAGQTIFVTLEPCNHFGRTPPCADLIVEKKIKRVVVGAIDPNPMMSGRSLERFRALGVEVIAGVLESECQKIIRGFATAIKKGRPYITLKAATSLDGKIATVTGESKWITSEESRAAAHQERAEHDAILVGVGTVLADDPRLDVRLPGQHKRGMTKVILDTDLRTPLTSQIFQTAGRVIIYCGAEFNAERRKALEAAGATVFPVKLAEHRKVLDIKTVVQHLAHRGVQELLVEGGAQVLGSFVREGLFDRLVQFMAPVILGADARSAFEGFTPHGLKEGMHLSKTSFTVVGPDLVFEGHV